MYLTFLQSLGFTKSCKTGWWGPPHEGGMNKYILTLLIFIFINLMCFIIRHNSKDFKSLSGSMANVYMLCNINPERELKKQDAGIF